MFAANKVVVNTRQCTNTKEDNHRPVHIKRFRLDISREEREHESDN